jgi:hypothetical protein
MAAGHPDNSPKAKRFPEEDRHLNQLSIWR